MFKRFLAFTLGILLLLGSALADLPDFASMSFDELNEMKQALDKEYQSRPESEGFNLGPDEYIVGRDLLPGTYYVSMVYPAYNTNRTTVKFYDSMEERNAEPKIQYHDHAKHDIDLKLGSDPQTLVLNDGEVVCVEWGSMFMKTSPYNPEDYYKYEPPEGVLIPKGTYTIGNEIPSGSYLVYPATVLTGAYSINGENFTRLAVFTTVDSSSITLNDNDEFLVSDSIVMTKRPAFNFD